MLQQSVAECAVFRVKSLDGDEKLPSSRRRPGPRNFYYATRLSILYDLCLLDSGFHRKDGYGVMTVVGLASGKNGYGVFLDVPSCGIRLLLQ